MTASFWFNAKINHINSFKLLTIIVLWCHRRPRLKRHSYRLNEIVPIYSIILTHYISDISTELYTFISILIISYGHSVIQTLSLIYQRWIEISVSHISCICNIIYCRCTRYTDLINIYKTLYLIYCPCVRCTIIVYHLFASMFTQLLIEVLAILVYILMITSIFVRTQGSSIATIFILFHISSVLCIVLIITVPYYYYFVHG